VKLENAASHRERIVTTSCSYDCGARCLLKVHVSEGRIGRITTDERPMPSLKGCLRGLAQAEIVHAPDRLLTPLKRRGARGEGRFEPVSWDDALGLLSRELKRVKAAYGNGAVLLLDRTGSLSPLHGMGKPAKRFFALFGGCTTPWGSASYEAARFAGLATYGTPFTGNTPDSFLRSRLILLWGWNPFVTRFGPDTTHYLGEARKAGARIVCVDPRRSQTCRAVAGEWIPIRPGTDGAMLIAMAHVMIDEGLYDRPFVETHTAGFGEFSDYVLGRNDGVPKTPLWAERITGVAAGTIEGLAREYAVQKPAALVAGWAPGRTAFGEQYHRCAAALSAMTGNIGIPGGWAAGGTNRVDLGFLKETFPVPDLPGGTIHLSHVFDALLKGRSGGYPDDLRLLYIVGGNVLNQNLNTNRGVEALKASEFVVVHERFMTPTARYADLVLPVTTCLERQDIGQPWSGGPYCIHMERAIEPLGEARDDLAIFTELASRLGLEGFNDRSDEAWLRAFVAATPGLPDYDTFAAAGFHEFGIPRPWIAFRDQIEGRIPFPTPSGKIELFSRTIAELKDPQIPVVPTYLDPWEGPADPLASRYPLQLVSPHARTRVNSQFDNIPGLKAQADDALWMNPDDAATRGIENGDRVEVFNDRGRMVRKVKVTEGIRRGVVSLDAGAWYRPDRIGVDQGGCVNVLTRDDRSPAGALPFNSCLVEVSRGPEE
jgi:anaerobic dimethyl sulfoxide reductase subunit A